VCTGSGRRHHTLWDWGSTLSRGPPPEGGATPQKGRIRAGDTLRSDQGVHGGTCICPLYHGCAMVQRDLSFVLGALGPSCTMGVCNTMGALGLRDHSLGTIKAPLVGNFCPGSHHGSRQLLQICTIQQLSHTTEVVGVVGGTCSNPSRDRAVLPTMPIRRRPPSPPARVASLLAMTPPAPKLEEEERRAPQPPLQLPSSPRCRPRGGACPGMRTDPTGRMAIKRGRRVAA